MSKIKEIDVWVTPKILESTSSNNFYVQTYEGDTAFLKAKLIIEIPDKKITISESEFENAFLKTYEDSLSFTDHMDLIKKELDF